MIDIKERQTDRQTIVKNDSKLQVKYIKCDIDGRILQFYNLYHLHPFQTPPFPCTLCGYLSSLYDWFREIKGCKGYGGIKEFVDGGSCYTLQEF